MDVTSNDFWVAIQKQIEKILTRPGMDIQLMLSVLAIAVALLISILTQRTIGSPRISSPRLCPPFSRL